VKLSWQWALDSHRGKNRVGGRDPMNQVEPVRVHRGPEKGEGGRKEGFQ